MRRLMQRIFGVRLPKATGRTHDFSSGNTWGWAFYVSDLIDGGKRIKGHGFGPRIHEGDWVLLKNNKSTTRYRITSIETVLDPDDMFFFEATFDPRSERPGRNHRSPRSQTN